MNTIQEFLMSSKDILCEIGTGTFETATRNILDIIFITALKKETHLPTFVDPSSSNWALVNG
jgi:3-deoxy-D-arabino-heptulosonate 7-phosphate (DAHP) synthase